MALGIFFDIQGYVATAICTYFLLGSWYTSNNQINGDFTHLIEQYRVNATNQVDQSKAHHVEAEQIMVVSAESCVACRELKQFFAKLDINYVDIDIDKQPKGLELMQLVGAKGTPVIIFNDKVLFGFSSSQMADELAARGMIYLITSH